MYAVVLTYTAPLSAVDEALPAHVAWLQEQYATGTFIASGRREPRIGGVVLARDMPEDDLTQVLASDPFATGALARYEVVRFHPSMLADDLTHHPDLIDLLR